VDEKTVQKKAVDMILSFDDVITHGHRESVTMAQLEAYLEMDSTDEKMFKKMQLIREMEAKEIAKKQQKEIARRKLDPAFKDTSSSSGNVKSISSQDYQSNLGLGPAQIGSNSHGSGASITTKSSAPTPSWMEESTA
jgi:coatomer subunit delta